MFKKFCIALLLLAFIIFSASAQEDEMSLLDRLRESGYGGAGGEEIVRLIYDEDSGDLPEEQSRYVAEVLREVQADFLGPISDNEAQQSMEDAVREIQSMAASVGATTLTGTTITLPWETQATWLVWCSNATQTYGPPDLHPPLGYGHEGWGELFIWATPAYEEAPDPIQMSFLRCDGGWAVAI
jgi:hypothetical protein